MNNLNQFNPSNTVPNNMNYAGQNPYGVSWLTEPANSSGQNVSTNTSQAPIFQISNNSGVEFTLRAPNKVNYLVPGAQSTFTLANGYIVKIYGQPNFQGQFTEVIGPVTAPLTLSSDQQAISLQVYPNIDPAKGGISTGTWILLLIILAIIIILIIYFYRRRNTLTVTSTSPRVTKTTRTSRSI
jgi:uncharacterized protein (UPF0333 family)